MKEIKLSRGLSALVDDDDFEKFGSMKWYAQTTPSGGVYAARTIWGPPRKIILLHRAIMKVSDRHVKVDHENHNTMDCQKKNLRVSTNSQNMANRSGANSNSESGIRGVGIDKRKGLWRARLMIHGVEKFLGYFSSQELAKKAVIEGREKHFVEFAGAA